MIPLHETEFDFTEINDKMIGAGILPVAVDNNGNIRMLMGKERYINHWRGSLKWSGFEGGRKSGEDIETTAAREFAEESIGVVPVGGEAASVDSVRQFLLSRNYIARIVLCIAHGNDCERRYHVTYLVQVPYDERCALMFSERRRSVVELQTKVHLFQRISQQLGAHASATPLPLEGQLHEGTRVETVKRADVLDTVLVIEYMDEKNKSHVHEFLNIAAETIDLYVRWMNARAAMRNACDKVSILNIDILTISRDKEGLIRNVVVNDDFIEKQQVQWWTLAELQTVLKNGGHFDAEVFRAYFLPVLQRAVQELYAISQNHLQNA